MANYSRSPFTGTIVLLQTKLTLCNVSVHLKHAHNINAISNQVIPPCHNNNQLLLNLIITYGLRVIEKSGTSTHSRIPSSADLHGKIRQLNHGSFELYGSIVTLRI